MNDNEQKFSWTLMNDIIVHEGSWRHNNVQEASWMNIPDFRRSKNKGMNFRNSKNFEKISRIQLKQWIKSFWDFELYQLIS